MCCLFKNFTSEKVTTSRLILANGKVEIKNLMKFEKIYRQIQNYYYIFFFILEQKLGKKDFGVTLFNHSKVKFI
jgi:hypothetical protein